MRASVVITTLKFRIPSASPGSHEAALLQHFTNALSKDFVNDAAGSSVHAPDGSALALNVIKKNDPIPEYPEPIKTVELSFEPADVSFFLLQVL